MAAITATEFAKSFGRYKEEAQREPVAIKSLPPAIAKAIKDSKMDSAHEHLNHLMDDK